jgi:hypothetical protein
MAGPSKTPLMLECVQKTPVFFIGDITNELWQLSLSLAFNLILFSNHLKLLVFSETQGHPVSAGGSPHARSAPQDALYSDP